MPLSHETAMKPYATDCTHVSCVIVAVLVATKGGGDTELSYGTVSPLPQRIALLYGPNGAFNVEVNVWVCASLCVCVCMQDTMLTAKKEFPLILSKHEHSALIYAAILH